jgi:hypothetical protein
MEASCCAKIEKGQAGALAVSERTVDRSQHTLCLRRQMGNGR